MRLKEILRARKGASAPAQATAQSSTDNHAEPAERFVIFSSIKSPLDDFYALFEDCTDY